MPAPLFRWLKIALINLAVVALLGIVLRYKILFPLPVVDQKHLLHGHSHFAFAGWVTQVLMTLLVDYLQRNLTGNVYKKYRWLLWANLLTAYGMLVTFPLEGYGIYSITFSTLSIFVSYVFALVFWKDLSRFPNRSTTHSWFKAALFFNALSSIGAFALAFMMANKVVHQTWYLSAQYFYLHFQYNGWFFFSCMGLFTATINRLGVSPKSLRTIFRLFAFAAVPAYLLSTLWMPLPLWIYILVVLAALAQAIALVRLAAVLRPVWKHLLAGMPAMARYTFWLSALALSIKLVLQLGSTIPALSDLAFGFRPIVIGYLHLVLLAVVTLYLLSYLFAEVDVYLNKTAATGLAIFAAAVILNEIVLMIQGVAAISYLPVPYVNHMLLGTAILLFSGAWLMSFAKRKYLQK